MRIAEHPLSYLFAVLRPGLRTAASTLVLGVLAALADATTVGGAPNDFIPSFTGAHSPDLDVLSTFATFDDSTFHIGATLNGSVETLPSACTFSDSIAEPARSHPISQPSDCRTSSSTR